MTLGPSPIQVVLISLMPFLLFPLVWLLATFVISRGWAPLVPDYKASFKPQGATVFAASARIGWAKYNNCLTMVVADEGLYMQIWAIFRAFQPALLIPWSAFGPMEEVQFAWVRLLSTTVRTSTGKEIRILFRSPAMVDLLKQKLAGKDAAEYATPAPIASPHQNSPWSHDKAIK